MMQSYVISVVDPTYRTVHVIGVFDNEEEATMARNRATKNIAQEADDRGCFYKITVFETNKLYRG
jgi:multidrug efflux pump subunit AcrA (membrane-fusion protein)